jgi:hypothetical protein
VESILSSTKKALGIAPENTDFDVDILMHLNSVLSILNQLGIGPTDGFAVEDDSPTWGDFLGDDKPRYNVVKTYVYLRTRLMFDPPQTSFAIEAMERQIEELGYRINQVREEDTWVSSIPVTVEPLW